MSAVLVAVIVGAFAFVGPLILKRQDYKRQDAVADRVKEAAELLATTSTVTQEKLDEIHVLVNSRLTAALDEIAALRAYLDGITRPGDPELPEPH
ncbi:MAG TPA: hypothetical protein VNN25_13650 [Thermoanaerobaculia bacterium]|nr:hypothetical protein [Thermoanaerobaculia bacterium]